MTWLGLLAIAVAVFQVGVVLWVSVQLDRIRGYRQDWQHLAETQRAHEVRLRYLHELVNPMARTGSAPMPKHLRQEKR